MLDVLGESAHVVSSVFIFIDYEILERALFPQNIKHLNIILRNAAVGK